MSSAVQASPLGALKAAYSSGKTEPVEQARRSLERANGNASRNTYIALDGEWTLAEAKRQTERGAGALLGLPVSLKDCFDLEGFETSSGSKFYAAHKGRVSEDSAVAARLRAAGAVIVGKTNLHQLAYGITGENCDYGDCLQPRDGTLLTGGSSSGAAASVQEGSALAAIGTDTGGSVRAPAALCGLAGYRSSLGVGDWRGGQHLAQSFDTIGWLFRDLRDGLRLAEALFDLPTGRAERGAAKIAVLGGAWRADCDAAVQEAMEAWQARAMRAADVEVVETPAFWFGAWEIYAPIQAYEAAQIHAGFYERFDPVIRGRLEWGARIGAAEVAMWRQRHGEYREKLAGLWTAFDFVLAPVTPVSRLKAGADHVESRARILRHTTPASLGGLPAVVLPSEGCGVQLMAAHNDDRRLLRFAARLGEMAAGKG